MQSYLPYIPLLLEGLAVTLQIFVLATLLAAAFAIFAGSVRFIGPARPGPDGLWHVWWNSFGAPPASCSCSGASMLCHFSE